MPLYEHVFLARQDISAQQVEALTDQFKTIIGDNGGSTAKTEYWGLRSLSYKIKKYRKAHYSLLNIDAPHAAVAEMERQMRLNDDVIRFLTLRVDEHDEGQSAILQSRGGRDDRRGPRRDFRNDRESGGGDAGAKSESKPEQSKPEQSAAEAPKSEEA